MTVKRTYASTTSMPSRPAQRNCSKPLFFGEWNKVPHMDPLYIHTTHENPGTLLTLQSNKRDSCNGFDRSPLILPAQTKTWLATLAIT